MTKKALKTNLDRLVALYERAEFIADDPISVPHAFSSPRDREVIGLYAALLAWGRRKTVLNKMAVLCEIMQYRPYDFVLGFDREKHGERLAGFLHRTFQPEDAIALTAALGAGLRQFGTVENLFARYLGPADETVEPALQGFSESMMAFVPETPTRLQKHLARPARGSSCKRLNMYLRWMVRPGPVDFGIWKRIRTEQLVLPLDVHSGRQARAWGLLTRRANDWKAAVELTERCRALDPRDPAKYDFALFGSGAYRNPPGASSHSTGTSIGVDSATER